MSSKWYLTRDGKERLGPFTSAQLYQLAATGQLARSDMVLKVGKRKWVKASSIRGLFSPPSQTPVVLQAVPVDAEELPTQVAEELEQFRSRRAKMLWFAVAIVGAFVLLPLLVVGLVSLDAKTLAAIGSVIIPLLVVVVVVGGLVGLVLAIVWSISSLTGWHTICPECNKKYARVEVGRKVVERKKCYGLVTRRAYSNSSGSISGSSHHWGQSDYQNISGSTRSSGSTSWQERVPVIRTTYEVRYQCKYCHARWIDEAVNQVEDFDIER